MPRLRTNDKRAGPIVSDIRITLLQRRHFRDLVKPLGAFPRALSRAQFAKIRQMILGMRDEVILVVRFAQNANGANLVAFEIVGDGFTHKTNIKPEHLHG